MHSQSYYYRFKCARQELNLDLRLRRPSLYPLSYGRMSCIRLLLRLTAHHTLKGAAPIITWVVLVSSLHRLYKSCDTNVWFLPSYMQLAGIEPTLPVPETGVLSVELQLPVPMATGIYQIGQSFARALIALRRTVQKQTPAYRGFSITKNLSANRFTAAWPLTSELTEYPIEPFIYQ
jgi:hypothetical protein